MNGGDNFKKQLFTRIGIALLVVAIFSAIITFLFFDITQVADGIEAKEHEIFARSKSMESIALLREEFDKSKPLSDSLGNVLPTKDQVIDFSKELDQAARTNSLQLDFIFKDEVSPSADKSGSIRFAANLTGSYQNTVKFLKAVEGSRFITRVDSFDVTSEDGKKYKTSLKGVVFFR